MNAVPTGQDGQRIVVVTGGVGARYAHFWSHDQRRRL
jgi:hypothetical protein